MTKAYAYCRVSGRGQVEGDGFDRQEQAIWEYAIAHGIETVETYREEGVSGTKGTEDRPAWLRMMAAIINNGVRTVLIEKLDRLARDLLVQETILGDLRRRGITLVPVLEPDLCADDPTRKLLRQFMGAIAEYEKAMIVLKLQGARRRMKAREGRCEGAKPYGFYPGEADTLEHMRQLAAGGSTPTAIARELDKREIWTRSGGKWHPYVVARILKAGASEPKAAA